MTAREVPHVRLHGTGLMRATVSIEFAEGAVQRTEDGLIVSIEVDGQLRWTRVDQIAACLGLRPDRGDTLEIVTLEGTARRTLLSKGATS